ncbi:MAG: phosphatase PAP2 family protein [Chloroflexi bacterium]|jgi:undecaprenyl-diphosphatase|nr:phosphatase PAP2 family protein [Chloroflexota bacterium]
MDRWRSLLDEPWLRAGVASAIGFLVVAALVAGPGTGAVDRAVAEAVRALPLPVASWGAVTQVGGWVLVPVGVALVLGLVAVGRARMALVVAVALIGASVLTDTLKDAVARPRPPDPLADAFGFSFPSGHALNSTVTYGIAALLVWRSWLPWRARFAGTATLVMLIALVGLSRVALGVHHPSDVVAGWLAGTAIVAVVALIDTADRAARAAVPAGGGRSAGGP